MALISREKFVEYVKRSTDPSRELSEDTTYYLELFDKYYKTPTIRWFIEWNWYACLLGPIWLAYRGMFWISILAIGALEQVKYFSISIYLISIIVLFPIMGAYGNALYLVHVERWVSADNKYKKGSDMTMACLMSVLFFCNSTVRLLAEFFH